MAATLAMLHWFLVIGLTPSILASQWAKAAPKMPAPHVTELRPTLAVLATESNGSR